MPKPGEKGESATSGDVADLAAQVAQHNAELAAVEDLRRYAQERHGRLLWRAYAECRAAGIPVPELVLRVFDQWAAALGDAEGPAETLRALELGGDSRNHRGRGHLAKAEQRHILAAEVDYLHRLRGKQVTEAIRIVATRHGLTETFVKKAYYRR